MQRLKSPTQILPRLSVLSLFLSATTTEVLQVFVDFIAPAVHTTRSSKVSSFRGTILSHSLHVFELTGSRSFSFSQNIGFGFQMFNSKVLPCPPAPIFPLSLSQSLLQDAKFYILIFIYRFKMVLWSQLSQSQVEIKVIRSYMYCIFGPSVHLLLVWWVSPSMRFPGSFPDRINVEG